MTDGAGSGSGGSGAGGEISSVQLAQIAAEVEKELPPPPTTLAPSAAAADLDRDLDEPIVIPPRRIQSTLDGPVVPGAVVASDEKAESGGRLRRRGGLSNRARRVYVFHLFAYFPLLLMRMRLCVMCDSTQTLYFGRFR